MCDCVRLKGRCPNPNVAPHQMFAHQMSTERERSKQTRLVEVSQKTMGDRNHVYPADCSDVVEFSWREIYVALSNRAGLGNADWRNLQLRRYEHCVGSRDASFDQLFGRGNLKQCWSVDAFSDEVGAVLLIESFVDCVKHSANFDLRARQLRLRLGSTVPHSCHSATTQESQESCRCEVPVGCAPHPENNPFFLHDLGRP